LPSDVLNNRVILDIIVKVTQKSLKFLN